MGWEIDREKTVEVRKNFPKDLNWNRKAIIYCSKNKQSFNRIPKKYQPLMEKFLGRVIGEFICDKIVRIGKRGVYQNFDYCYLSLNIFGNDDIETEITTIQKSCISKDELNSYGAFSHCLYAWHISNLVIYDKPKELGEFMPYCKGECTGCKYLEWIEWYQSDTCTRAPFKRPPQSWCYVEELGAICLK